MRLHDAFTLQVIGPPAVGLLPGLRELYGLWGPAVSRGPSIRDIHNRLYGADGEQDTFYHATFERQTVAAMDMTGSRANRKVGLIHRLFTAPAFRKKALAQQLLTQAIIDFSVLGGEVLLLTVPRSTRAYRYIRNVRFTSYPDILFAEAPDPDSPEGVNAPVPGVAEAAAAAATVAAIAAPAAETSGEAETNHSDGGGEYSEWGSYDTGDSGYHHNEYENSYTVKPPLPEPTRTDGTALFYALFGRGSLNDFSFIYFNINIETRVRPLRPCDWAGLALLLNWPMGRKLVHLHKPHLRRDPIDLELMEFFERLVTGRAHAVALETAEGALVGAAFACPPPAAGDPKPPLPGKRPKAAATPAGPPIVELFVFPDFAAKAPELLAELKKLRPFDGAAAYVEADQTSSPAAAWNAAGFKQSGAVPEDLIGRVPGLQKWVCAD